MNDETRITFNKSMRRVSKALQEPDADWEKEFQNFRAAIRVAFHGKSTSMQNKDSSDAFVELIKHPGCTPKVIWPGGPFGGSIEGFISWVNADIWEGIRKNPIVTLWVDDGWAPLMEQILLSGQIGFFMNLEKAAAKIDSGRSKYLDAFQGVLPRLTELGFPDVYFKKSKEFGDRWSVANMPSNFPAYEDWLAVGTAAHLIAKTFELGDDSAVLASSFMFEGPR